MLFSWLRLGKDTLRLKIICYTIILVIVSLVFTSVTAYMVSKNIIKNKVVLINRMLTDAAADRTNTFLGELANIINLSLKNENLDYIINSKDIKTMAFYNAISKYEDYLRNFILHYDKIDGLAVVNSDTVVSMYNEGVYYKNYIFKAYYDKVCNDDSPFTKNSFFLERYIDGRDGRIAVIRPIYTNDGKKANACMVVILSSKFSKELQFAGDNIYLMDHRGVYASVKGKENKPQLASLLSKKNKGLDKRSLIFNGWKIINVSLLDEVYRDFSRSRLYCAAFGVIYFLLSILVVMYTSRRLVAPIIKLNEEIKALYAGCPYGNWGSLGKSGKSFRNRLALFFSLLAVIPVITITAGYYLLTKTFIENRVGSIFSYNADLLAQQVGSILNKNYRVGVEIQAKSEVQDFLYGGGRKGLDANQLSAAIINKKAAGQDVLNISLFDSKRNLLYSSFYSKYFMEGKSYLKNLERMDAGVFPVWTGLQESNLNRGFFTVGLHVWGTTDNVPVGAKLGYILLDLDADELVKSLNSFTSSSNGGIYLLDGSGSKILEVFNEKAPELAKFNPYKSQTVFNRNSIKIKKTNYMIMKKSLDINNWSMLILISMKEYVRENQSILFYSIALVIILIILSSSFSFSFSLVLGRNINALLAVVRSVKSGNLAARFTRRTGDEIEELGNSFNEMLERLNLMIDEKLMAEVKIKDAEIKAKEYELNLLQAQINPHFLYNTLKTCQYMVFCNDSRAEKMIKLLIYLFRTSIGRGEKLIMLKDELEHVRAYLEIQQIRFSDKFDIVYDIPEDTLELYVLKLTLQPIVENAIYHGLELCEDRGRLTISVRKHNGRLKVVIADDGAGMSEEKLTELIDVLQGKQKSKSIGIYNVHERIQLHFGSSFGIEVESSETKGTGVTLWFPVIDRLQEQIC